jgi:ABC-type iron transport system FetAB permease component
MPAKRKSLNKSLAVRSPVCCLAGLEALSGSCSGLLLLGVVPLQLVLTIPSFGLHEMAVLMQLEN